MGINPSLEEGVHGAEVLVGPDPRPVWWPGSTRGAASWLALQAEQPEVKAVLVAATRAKWYCDTMKTTIDKAGRVVIPAPIRERLGLRPGTELEVVEDDFSIRLVRSVPGPKLVRVGGRWVARPSVPQKDLPDLDVARLVEGERDRWPW